MDKVLTIRFKLIKITDFEKCIDLCDVCNYYDVHDMNDMRSCTV